MKLNNTKHGNIKKKSQNKYKPIGPNDISPHVQKECYVQSKFPIMIIFDKSVAHGRVLNAWKKQHNPSLQKGDKEHSQSNRPISLTSVIRKKKKNH